MRGERFRHSALSVALDQEFRGTKKAALPGKRRSLPGKIILLYPHVTINLPYLSTNAQVYWLEPKDILPPSSGRSAVSKRLMCAFARSPSQSGRLDLGDRGSRLPTISAPRGHRKPPVCSAVAGRAPKNAAIRRGVRITHPSISAIRGGDGSGERSSGSPRKERRRSRNKRSRGVYGNPRHPRPARPR